MIYIFPAKRDLTIYILYLYSLPRETQLISGPSMSSSILINFVSVFATMYVLFSILREAIFYPSLSGLGGGYFRIVSALTSHNLLARGPNNLIKHQTF